MKTLFVLFLFLFSLSGFSQKNTVYLLFAPEDKGLGLRYDRQMTCNYPWEKNYGVYTSGTWGNYKLASKGSIKNHVKFALGVYRSSRDILNSRSTYIFNLGLTYHYYGERNYQEGTINEHIFFPLSVDLGTGIRFKNRIVAGFDFDLIKWEGSLKFGINF